MIKRNLLKGAAVFLSCCLVFTSAGCVKTVSYTHLAEKPTDASKEFSASIEVNIPDDEFNTKYTQGREEKKSDRSKQIKRILFAPVAASVAVVSIVFSSLGYDPLGKDVFKGDKMCIRDRCITE